MLPVLVQALRAAGLTVSVEELSDILWLAERWPGARAERQPDQSGNSKQVSDDTDDDGDNDDLPPPSDHATVSDKDPKERAADHGSTPVHSVQTTGTLSASTLRVPGVASISRPQDLRRSLQPFARRVPSRWRSVLDEEETASMAADTDVWCPVYRPLRERWFEISVVAEDSPSMALWKETLDEFTRLLRNQGRFRSVNRYRLAENGTVSADDRRTGVAPTRLLDPTRRHLILLATDASSPKWPAGPAYRFLFDASAKVPVSLLQVLPRRAWKRTAVGEPEVSLYCERPGVATNELKTLLPWWIDTSASAENLSVPVIGFEPETIRQWARGMTGRAGSTMPGLLLAKPATDAPAEPMPARKPSELDPVARVERFRRVVSEDAFSLAVYLSVPDPLTIPVMRLIQRTMLPDTGTAELAEFFVGGLLELAQTEGGDAKTAEPGYRLSLPVRQELERALRYSEETEITAQLRSVGRMLLDEGRPGQSFEAVFPSPTGSQRITPWSLPFASLSQAVIARSNTSVEPRQDARAPAATGNTDSWTSWGAQPVLSITRTGDGNVLYFDLHPMEEVHRAVLESWDRLVGLARTELLVPEVLVELAGIVLPPTLVRSLARIKQGLVLIVAEDLEFVPWEALLQSEFGGFETNWFALNYFVVRHVPLQRRVQAEVLPDVRHLPMLIAAPSLGPSPSWDPAYTMAVLRELASLPSDSDAEVQMHSSHQEVLEALGRTPFDVLFVSGEGIDLGGPRLQEGSRFVVAMRKSDRVLTLQDFTSARSFPPPKVVFLACSHLGAWARALLESGVSVVVAAAGVVPANSTFPVRFFAALAAGATLGEATLAARQASFRQSNTDASWLNYHCYGDPDFRLVSRIQQTNASQDQETNVRDRVTPLTPKQSRFLTIVSAPDLPEQSGAWLIDGVAITFSRDMRSTGYARAGDTELKVDVETFEEPLPTGARQNPAARPDPDRIQRPGVPKLTLLSDQRNQERVVGQEFVRLRRSTLRLPSSAQVLIFDGHPFARVDVLLTDLAGFRRWRIEPASPKSPWPLPPEALGAPVMVNGRCVGLVAQLSDSTGAENLVCTTDSLVEALRYACLRQVQMSRRLHAEWVSEDGRKGTRLSAANFDLSGSNLLEQNFQRADLTRVIFRDAKLRATNFAEAVLQDADFRGADVSRCDFSRSDLRGARFKRAQLVGCRWEGANLAGAVFDLVDQADPPLREAIAASSPVDERTVPLDIAFLFQPSEDSAINRISRWRPDAAAVTQWLRDPEGGNIPSNGVFPLSSDASVLRSMVSDVVESGYHVPRRRFYVFMACDVAYLQGEPVLLLGAVRERPHPIALRQLDAFLGALARGGLVQEVIVIVDGMDVGTIPEAGLEDWPTGIANSRKPAGSYLRILETSKIGIPNMAGQSLWQRTIQGLAGEAAESGSSPVTGEALVRYLRASSSFGTVPEIFGFGNDLEPHSTKGAWGFSGVSSGTLKTAGLAEEAAASAKARKRILISSPSQYSIYAGLLETALNQDLQVERPTEGSINLSPTSPISAPIDRVDALVTLIGTAGRRRAEAEISQAKEHGIQIIAILASPDVRKAGELRDLAVANVDAEGRVLALSGQQGTAATRVINSTAINILRSMKVDTAPMLHELQNTYEDATSRFFNPPSEVRRLGRRLREGTFRELTAQIGPDELLLGLYENQAPALVATHINSRARLHELSTSNLMPLGYYALQRESANRGWDRAMPALAKAAERPMVVVSYVSAYATLARALVSALEATGGIDVRYDGHLSPGQPFPSTVLKWIDQSDALVVLVGPASAQANFSKGELERAQKLRKPVLPVVVEAGALPSALASYQAINVDSDGTPTLLARLRGHRLESALRSVALQVIEAVTEMTGGALQTSASPEQATVPIDPGGFPESILLSDAILVTPSKAPVFPWRKPRK